MKRRNIIWYSLPMAIILVIFSIVIFSIQIKSEAPQQWTEINIGDNAESLVDLLGDPDSFSLEGHWMKWIDDPYELIILLDVDNNVEMYGVSYYGFSINIKNEPRANQ